MKRNLSGGPVLPLAIFAMLLMVPVFFISNSKSNLTRANAMRVTLPSNEPNYMVNEEPVRPSAKPTATPKTYPVKTSSPTYY